MRTQCIEAVTAALGRLPDDSEIRGIEARIGRSLRRAARLDPEFAGLTMREQMERAGKLAAQELLADAAKTQQRAALAVEAHARALNGLNDGKAAGESMFRGLGRLLERADVLIKGIQHQYFTRMMDTITATEPRFFGLIEDARGVRDLVAEMFGQDSGNPVAKKGAEAWRATADAMRERFNRAGGQIARRRDWHLPQPTDTARVRAVDSGAWAAEIMPLLDRGQYLDFNGTRLSDSQLFDVLREIKLTFDTEGVKGLEPGSSVRRRMLANRHIEHRELHFKDADSWLSYQAKYGKGSVFTALQGHVQLLAREIGLLESFGPNPQAEFVMLHDIATKDGGTDALGPFVVSTKSLWASLSGFTSQVFNGNQPAYQRFADIAQGVRNVEVFGKLGSAFLSSITDVGTFFITTGFNRLPLLTSTVNLVRSIGGDSGMRDLANRAGLIGESIISDMNRWGESNIGAGWTGRLANATMRASLLNAWTDAIRRAFSVTMMGSLGRMSRTGWDALQAVDREHLARKGVSATDWQVYQLATPEHWRGEMMLTPEAIEAIPGQRLAHLGDARAVKDAAIARLLGVITDEAEYASLAPDLFTRAALQRGTQRGTIEGELLRSVALFKSFPVSMVSRHWVRAFESERFAGMNGNASKVAYATALASSLTIFGAIALQLKDLRDGKDPRNMTDPKFWMAALAQGGGGGIIGDFLYSGLGGLSRHEQSLWGTVLGPVASTVEDLVKLTIGNVGDLAKGRDTHAGAEALRVARQHLPVINLWYARTVLDHAFLHELQEYLSPGYLSRMQQRARKEWGQGFWWTSGAGIEEARAPEFGAALGN